MNIHEYQAKEVFKRYGIPVPEGQVAFEPEQAKQVSINLGGNKFAVKAQVHAGGRGKAGGIKIVSTADEVFETAKSLIGKRLVTHQTGPVGKLVNAVLVEKASEVQKEFYIGVTLDRSKEKAVIIASTEGGMEIEEVAKRFPKKIFKEYVDPFLGIQEYKLRRLASRMELPQVCDIVRKLVKLFIELDVSLCEINPLILTTEGNVMALDAKIVFDDNALYKHKDIQAYYDKSQDDPREVIARETGISFVGLDGNIGCLVNGAGLAMATMDLVLAEGGKPANFLDVGGGASLEQVKKAFEILLSDKNIKSIFVNIFGGIMRCDVVAKALVGAAREIGVKVPIVIRLEGTNVEQGREILRSEGGDLNIVSAPDMRQASKLAVKFANM